MLDARQLGLKLIANVTYGYTSASFSGRMPCVELADAIVQTGRDTLQRVRRASAMGSKTWIVLTRMSMALHVVRFWVRPGQTDHRGRVSGQGRLRRHGQVHHEHILSTMCLATLTSSIQTHAMAHPASLFVLLPGMTHEEAFRTGQAIADRITELNPKPIKLRFEKVRTSLQCYRMGGFRTIDQCHSRFLATTPTTALPPMHDADQEALCRVQIREPVRDDAGVRRQGH